jgi:type VI secretion system secreted protein Hcp
MAVDIFLDLAGVQGESKDEQYKDMIDVISWGWGYSLMESYGERLGQLSVNDLTVRKYIDIATPRLSERCWRRTRIGKGKLICRKAGGAAALEYFEIRLEEVLVTGSTMTGQRVNEQFIEDITLNFRKATISYVEQAKTGIKGKLVESEVDLAARGAR